MTASVDHTAPPDVTTIPQCPLCGSTSTAVLLDRLEDVEDRIPGQYGMSRCGDCSFLFLSPRPALRSLAKCYPSSYHARTDGKSKAHPLAARLYDVRYRRRYARIRPYLSGAKAVVELGAGDRQFMTCIKRIVQDGPVCDAFDVDEVDLNQDFSLPRRYQVALLYQVLEHVWDPVETLRRVGRFLDAGAFLVVETPNIASFWARAFPRHWAGLQIPRHLSFFTPATLTQCLSRAGFAVVEMSRVFDPGDLSVSLCSFLTDRFRLKTPPRKAKFFIPLALMSAPLVALQNIAGDSGALEIVARKG